MLSQPRRIVIVAGEESGDLHAAVLVKKLFEKDKSLIISGIGGRHLQTAGVQLISDLARFGVTGLSEVIRHALVIKKAFSLIKSHLEINKPDLLILVDYPGFNLRLAKFAKKVLGLTIIYYISPQIWAWKANRIETIRAYVDKIAVILPFEKAIYENAKISVAFVGHPLVDKIRAFEKLKDSQPTFDFPKNKKITAILPGSRRNEILKHMPVLAEVIKKFSVLDKTIHFVIPIAGTLEPALIQQYFHKEENISFIQGRALEVVAASDCAVVASGTASLECALLEKPMCIIYKVSRITHMAASKFMQVKYLGLCNLLENKMIVPELLQDDCNAKELISMIAKLLYEKETIFNMKKNLNRVKNRLSASQADITIEDFIYSNLEKKNVRT